MALLIVCAWSAPAVSAASPAAASSAEPDPDPEPEPEPETTQPVDRSQERLCHREKETGSYIGKKACRTRADKELALRAACN